MKLRSDKEEPMLRNSCSDTWEPRRAKDRTDSELPSVKKSSTDKEEQLEAMLAHAMLSLPATKGFEFGSGFEGTAMRGSQHNDPYVSTFDDPSADTAFGATMSIQIGRAHV